MAIFSAIGYGVAYLAGATGLVSVATATAIGLGAANLARSMALSAVAQAFAPKPKITKQELQATINQANGPRTVLYGQGILGGTRAFWEAKNGLLYQIILLNHGPLSGRINYLIDGVVVAVDASGVVTGGPQDGAASISWRSGASGPGGNHPVVTDAFPSIWDNSWLQGQATLNINMLARRPEEFARNWPKGENTDIQLEAYGKPVFDFLSLSEIYSDNAANVIGDYLSSPDGFDISPGAFDVWAWQDFATDCLDQMTLRAGGTENRYRLWGAYDLSEAPKAVLQRMEAACDARVYETAEGKVGILGGVYVAPDFTLTDDDIYSFQLVEGVAKRNRFNVVRGIYTSAAHGYQDTEADPTEDAAALATQSEKTLDLSVVMSPSHGQTKRLMKIALGRGNRDFTLKITTNIVGLKARFPQGRGHHVIRVQYPIFDFDEVCEVVVHEFYSVSLDGGGHEYRCDIELAAIDPAWWGFDGATEEGNAPISGDYLAVDGVPTAVISALSVSGSGSTQVITCEVVDPSREDLVLEAFIDGRFGEPRASMEVTGLTAQARTLNAETTYSIRVRFAGGAMSAPTTIATT
jgi:hypothetical protein